MTANDIVKDLESVIAWFTNHGSNTNTAVIDISQRAIDVIERQRDRIKQLWEDCDYFEDKVKTIKSETIGEFLERLKERTFECDVSQGYNRSCIMEVVSVIEIDYLASEMTEDNDAERKEE